MNRHRDQRDQADGDDRMHDEREPMPGRCIRAFDSALDKNAILVTLADDSGHGASLLQQALSGRRLAQDLVELVIECQLLFLSARVYFGVGFPGFPGFVISAVGSQSLSPDQN